MENRRNFMVWLGSFLGLGAVNTSYQAPKTKGFLIVYLNVGCLSPFNAEAFVEKWKKRLLDKKTLNDWELIIIPVRPPQETKIEFFAEGSKIPPLKAQELFPKYNEVDFVIPEKQTTLDYILLMLGAPVVKIELDQRHLDLAYDETKAIFEQVGQIKGLGVLNKDGCGQEQFKKMALARAKVMLGYVRRKYNALGNAYALDGSDLVEEGSIDLSNSLEHLSAL